MRADPRLPELFEHACELAGEERATWLADLRRSDPALASEIAELLDAAPEGARLFDSPRGCASILSASCLRRRLGRA